MKPDLESVRYQRTEPPSPRSGLVQHSVERTAGLPRFHALRFGPPPLTFSLADFAPLDIMKPPIPKSAFVVLLFSVVCIMTCVARIVPAWPYEKLVAESDMVALVEPVENKPTPDTFPGFSYGHPTNRFTATDTRFKVHTVLKGDTVKELTVLHFSYSTNASIIINGANFIHFFTGPLQYEKRAVKDGKPVGGITTFQQPPEWIAFLKRGSDGRFEPVTGHYDSAYSFRELHTASFYGKP